MRKNFMVLFLAIGIIFTLGCAGKRVKLDPNDPVGKYKLDFLEQYGFFVTNREPVSYYQESLGKVGKEREIFNSLQTIEELDKFTEIFWKVRDPNPSTPENEFKDEKDKLIQDVKDDILMSDIDIPLTSFSRNGGLKSDLAHVYLLYGPPLPQAKLKLQETNYRVELMVWYYLDVQGKQLFRFLFYDRSGKMVLFRNYRPLMSFDDLIDPLLSPLREISLRPGPDPQDLYELWIELERDDPEGIFRAALLQFSDYSDVLMENGNIKRKTIGALDPPEPAALTAVRFKPTILGQPGDLEGREFIKSSYHSLIPVNFRMGLNGNTGRYTFFMMVKHGDLDWEIKGERDAECRLLLRMSFQNKTTKQVKEFLTVIRLEPSREYIDKNNMTAKEYLEKNKDIIFPVTFDQLPNSIKGTSETLANMVQALEPGTYVVNVDIHHEITKKSAGGWRSEIEIK